MVVLALAGSYAMRGRLRLSPRALLRYAAATGGDAGGDRRRPGFRPPGPGHGQLRRRAARLRDGALLRTQPAPARVLGALPEASAAPAEASPLKGAVQSRGTLRVGFVAGQHPYSYFNARGELVGFDIEMAHALGRELGVPVELAPVAREQLAEALEGGRVDVIMAGVVVTTRRATRMTFSAPYLDETLAFVVPDHARSDFSDAAWVRAQPGLRLGVPDLPYLAEVTAREFPGASIVPLPLGDPEAAFAAMGRTVDAVVLTAERGSFLTLLHPAFSVAVPRPLHIRLPIAYAVARHDVEAARFLSTWIDLKKKDGTIQSLYDHWILGLDAKAREPRWSILRDVLGWDRPTR